MQPREIQLSESNLNTTESRHVLRYILDRAELQVEFDIRVRQIRQSIEQLLLIDEGYYAKQFQPILGKIKAIERSLSKKDLLLEAGKAHKALLSQLEDVVTSFLKAEKAPYTEKNRYTIPTQKLQALNTAIEKNQSALDQKHDLFLDSINYAELKSGSVTPIILNGEQTFLELDNVTILTRPHGKKIDNNNNKEGGVLEIIVGRQLVGEGGFAEVRKLNYKAVKQGKQSTQLLTYGLDTKNDYVVKTTKDVVDDSRYFDAFVTEEKLLTDVMQHTHAKQGSVGNVFMRALPNMELYDALYKEDQSIAVDPKDAGDFFIQFAKKLLTTYHSQIEKKGIVHQDLKPENIRVEVSADRKTIGEINFIDFNISQKIGQQHRGGGTQAYFAPETIKKNEKSNNPLIASTVSDVYVLAMVLIETFAALSGYGDEIHESIAITAKQIKEVIDDGEDADFLLQKRQQHLLDFLKNALRMTDLNPKQREQLVELFKTMLSTNPKRRDSTASAIKILEDIEYERTKQKIIEKFFEAEIKDLVRIKQSELEHVNSLLKIQRDAFKVAEASGNAQALPELKTEIAKLEEQQISLVLDIDRAKGNFILKKLQDVNSPVHQQLAQLEDLKKFGMTLLEDEIQKMEQATATANPIEKLSFSILTFKKVFEWLNNKYKDNPIALEYFVNNLPMDTFRNAKSLPDVIAILATTHERLQGAVPLLDNLQSKLDELKLRANNHPAFDSTKLSEAQTEIDNLKKLLSNTPPAEIDKIVKTLDKIEKRTLRIKWTLFESENELLTLDLKAEAKAKAMALKIVKEQFLVALNADHSSKKPGLLERTTSVKVKEKQKSELTQIINDARDVSTLVNAVKGYVEKIPAGFFHAQGIRQRMESAINSVAQNAPEHQRTRSY